MNYRPLGKTGLTVSEIGIGAWQLGGPLVLDGKTDGHPDLGRDFCVHLIRQCREELGINFIDTAEQYGNGESERRVGEGIKGVRDQWIVSTKFGNQVGPHGERLQDGSPQRIPISLEGSLKRLQTDYLDVYLYHIHPVPGEAEIAAQFLLDAKARGQVRSIGISTNSLPQMEYLKSLGCLDVVQFPHSMMSADDSIPNFLQENGVAGVVRGAFEGGRLSGRYFRQAPQFSPDDIRSNRIKAETAAHEFSRYALFEELLEPGREMIPLALRYLLDYPAVASIIPGGKSLADYQKASRASDLAPLTADERLRVAQIREYLRASSQR
ncbi:MAG: aldo/keto reductase [Verrucomicrobia bacterium]|nr:aldo/keto reductase [Verrucomicrobiota bacterium]